MLQRGMDRRIAGIIRWLERFQSAYRSGAIESALMDAECARADLEDLRLDVWAKVGRAPRRPWIGAACRTFLLTCLLVTATALPLARDVGPQPARPSGPARQDVEVREAREAKTPPGPEMALEKIEKKKPRRAAVPAQRRPAAAEKTERRAEKKTERTVPHDKVFSLMQTGARALKNERPVIKIDRKMGKGEGTL